MRTIFVGRATGAPILMSAAPASTGSSPPGSPSRAHVMISSVPFCVSDAAVRHDRPALVGRTHDLNDSHGVRHVVVRWRREAARVRDRTSCSTASPGQHPGQSFEYPSVDEALTSTDGTIDQMNWTQVY